MEKDMQVTKRDGQLEDVSFDKILKRVKRLGAECQPPLNVNYSQLVMKVIDQLYDKISTKAIDELTAEQCASMATKHPDYGTLASRIIVSNHHKNTSPNFYHVMSLLYGQVHSMVSHEFFETVSRHRDKFQAMLQFDRDYSFDYFGFKTLERAYLMRVNDQVVERPQHMWLRVAIGIHGNNVGKVKQTYDLMSLKYFTHATPTLFNAGTPHPQLSSCFLLAMKEDSIAGIYDTLAQCANISKWAGGIGLHVHNIRAAGSHINGTNGKSNGIVPMLGVYNKTARYVDQGGGKRNGSFAIYLEPWHADIEDFLMMKRNQGDEEMRARDLFYGLWIPDLFMERVKADGDWHLFCPNEAPGLADVWGAKFVELYTTYVAEKRYRKVMKARELWLRILDSQMETGTPYLLYKDAANAKSNQQNLGTIKSSNLCTEIIEFSSPTETAVCNLASIALCRFVKPDKTFDYQQLHHVARVVTHNLDRVIDQNFYPTPQTETSNLRHRPIGIGVQGLADTFALMDIAFDSEEARKVNQLIFETIYHGALKESNKIAMKRHRKIARFDKFDVTYTKRKTYRTYDELTKLVDCYSTLRGAYSSFLDSPASQGILQFDLWNVQPTPGRYDWNALKSKIKVHGLRNSLLVAPMPTATTSQILGFNECFEPFTSNIYSRRTNAGEFVVVNKYLQQELVQLGVWSEAVKDNIILNRGSIQQLQGIAQHIKDKYKTVWEIPMSHIIQMAADRAPFICQSQSLNLFVEDPDYKTLTALHFQSWQAGLKTGMYYLRRKPRHQPQQFTIVPELAQATTCDMCSA